MLRVANDDIISSKNKSNANRRNAMIPDFIKSSDVLLVWIGRMTDFVVNDMPENHADSTVNAIGDAVERYGCDSIAVLWDESSSGGDGLAQSFAGYLSRAYPNINTATLSTAERESLKAAQSYFTIFCIASNPPSWINNLPGTLASTDSAVGDQPSSEASHLESTWSTLGFVDSQTLRRKISTLQVILKSPADFNLSRCILLTGETGVGKTRLAELLAKQARPSKPYVHVNCATLPPQLADSMIFGSVKGAFSDSVDKKGYIEAAGKGILFLDEVGELPLETQAHLLTVLESERHHRFGQTEGEGYPIECKFIFGTNKDLWAEVRAGRFREDLLHRIDTHNLEIPPLRKRIKSPIGDVFLLSLIKNLCGEHGQIHLTNNAHKALMCFAKDYQWPGNIREFKQLIQTTAASTLLHGTKRTVSSHLMNHIIAEKKSDILAQTAEQPVELMAKIKQRWPAYAHGEIEAIFKAAAAHGTGAEAGKEFFFGGKKVANYSDAFKKHIRKFGIKWDKTSSCHLSEI